MSALFHLAILLALVLPTLVARQLDLPLEGGAGGPGPAGGGGGGTGGSGGETVRTERLRFLQIAQPAAPKAAAPVVPPIEKKPEVIPPPPVEKAPEPVTPTPSTQLVAPAPSSSVTLPVPGRGGGTGTDGSAGNGPGSGGGIGSGVGTGRGTGNGPGTGGGPGDIYPPQVTNLAILPIPVPSKVRPYKLIAYFDVDEKGNAKLISFNPSRDGGYNKKIREMLAEVRFRPAVRWDGTTVRDTAWITAEAPR